MPDIAKRLGHEVLVIDGAFGTMLQRAEVPAEQCPEQLNVTAPEIVAGIHRDYVLAGADCVTSNSFGGTRVKLAEYGLADQVDLLNRAAVRVAREAGAQHVLADVGPSGLVLEPLGEATFDEVHELFVEQIEALAAEEPDAIIIETMTDIAEARCAVLAAKSVCDLPVIASVTFGLAGRMDLSGTDPATAAVVLEAAGADAVGMNCGLGPEQMLPLVAAMAGATTLPVIVQPNAGLPQLVDGRTVFPGTADEMGAYAARFVEEGASLVGSCCGSSPSFTGAIVDFAKEVPVAERATANPGGTDAAGDAGPRGFTVAGPRGIARIGGGAPLAVIGERINPTGKPALADSLRAGSMEVVRSFAVQQQHGGAHLLDVNVGAPGVDAADALPAAVKALVGMSDLPLVLDTTDAAALEAALRVYPGRALVNSVSGEEASMEAVLPLVARYGAAVVVLALDDSGIPETPEGRVAIVRRVRDRARAYGIPERYLLVDVLTLTAATDPHAAATTLEALRVVSRELGLATMLGVSNVSHGLPGRPALNAAFLSMAAGAGLDAAIVNPDDSGVMRAIAAADALLGRDDQCARWVARTKAEERAADGGPGGHARPEAREAPYSDSPRRGPAASPAALRPSSPTPPAELRAEPPGPPSDTAARLAAAVESGDSDGAPALVDELIASGMAPGAVIGEVLTPAIQNLGDAFGRGEAFLPQLMVGASAMKVAVDRAKSHLPAAEAEATAGTVVFATVKGDIHSIGKDICVSLLESQGYSVRDLGVDVPAADVASAAALADADAVCLSALMTTTLPAMKATIEAVEEAAPGTPVLVGGAVVTEEWARSIGAGYSDDAPGCVREVSSAIERNGG